ncbi:HAD family hydrolase [Paenibacillus allorhizosphaerae]|uniref:5-amino-6-(5-phospho-D-ribitylamino)uracil phosphatase YcsE n=1 Tax=Paenibacillus allorhizosphaerae TaxID=2849866 RepID=A0ABM8VSV2_9BACL|nr:Cof-type HAD-IIB family hydrolase [Paenibacillus allorhizosphaerae]CAG7656848.1 5-amino-6-(5-phospho-D-ribitylamino)uracil phosphatase YcsE [Paenibacillus allorhizosphaerae]
MGDYKLIALDMDGTLLNKGAISEENVKCIQAVLEQGKNVILATGRPIRDVLPYTEKLNLELPLVINNGSEVWRTPKALHSRHLLTGEQVERICKYIFSLDQNIEYWAHTVRGTVDQSNFPDNCESVQWLQFAVKTEDEALRHRIREELAAWNTFEISNSSVNNIECNPIGVSKASGLTEICRMIGIEMSEVIAVGDSLNDISMICAAGLGVAMGNAQQAVKDAADHVAPTNRENGVAAVIKRFMVS